VNEILIIPFLPETHLSIQVAKKAYDPTVQEIRGISPIDIVEVD
jgi:hypothetical protein